MEEIIEIITSTEMPDGKYPIFRLLKTKNKCYAEFSWYCVKITAVGFDEEVVTFEAAIMFTAAVENILDEMLSKGGSS
jgi:hypothetical protein